MLNFEKVAFIIFIIFACCILLIAGFVTPKYVEAFEMNMNTISMIESSNDPLAFNKRTEAYGLYQITQPCLDDVNKHLICTDYIIQDMFDPSKGYVVAYSYLNALIPRYLKHYGIPDTVETRIMAYNWGIGNVILWGQGAKEVPKETLNYIIKYNELTGRSA